MGIYDSELWQNDIDTVINTLPVLEKLSGKSVMITGAGGLVCSAITDVLLRYNEKGNSPIHIYVAARSKDKIRSRFEGYFNKPYFNYIYFDAVSQEFVATQSIDYIIYGANNAFPSSIIDNPVETIKCSICGLLGMLDFGKEKGAQRLLYISSSEIYGRIQGSEPITEDRNGYIELLNSRNAYSIGKRAAETLCISYSDEYNFDTVIVRPGHIYGPTASEIDNRVASQWAYSAARGDNIEMKSDGEQMRSYCYCLDCASAILTVLLKGKRKQAYNISNPTSVISIKEMARILSEYGGVDLIKKAATNNEKKGFNPMSNSSLNADALIELGWKWCFDAEEGLSHTVQIIKKRIGIQ